MDTTTVDPAPASRMDQDISPCNSVTVKAAKRINVPNHKLGLWDEGEDCIELQRSGRVVIEVGSKEVAFRVNSGAVREAIPFFDRMLPSVEKLRKQKTTRYNLEEELQDLLKATDIQSESLEVAFYILFAVIHHKGEILDIIWEKGDPLTGISEAIRCARLLSPMTETMKQLMREELTSRDWMKMFDATDTYRTLLRGLGVAFFVGAEDAFAQLSCRIGMSNPWGRPFYEIGRLDNAEQHIPVIVCAMLDERRTITLVDLTYEATEHFYKLKCGVCLRQARDIVRDSTSSHNKLEDTVMQLQSMECTHTQVEEDDTAPPYDTIAKSHMTISYHEAEKAVGLPGWRGCRPQGFKMPRPRQR